MRNRPPAAAVPRPRRRWDFAALTVTVCAFVLSALWAFSTPIPIGRHDAVWGNFHPDEGSHIAVVEYSAAHRTLPPYERPWDTAVHPPLYHSGIAALVDGAAEPVLGRAGALRLVRLLSALMGAGVVFFTFVAGRAVAGRRTALLASWLVLLVPMRASLAGGITNENLAALGAAGACAWLAVGLRRGFDRGRVGALTLWTVLGVGSKLTCLALVPAEALVLWQAARRRGMGWRVPAGQFAVSMAALAAATGWWFVGNVRLYGDPFRKAAADRLWDAVQPGYAVLAAGKGMPPWRYAVSIYGKAFMSFWGIFDGFTVWMPWGVYGALLVFQVTTAGGLVRLARSRPRRFAVWWPVLAAWGIIAGWSLLVYTQYNWRHYTPQGRYFFVLLAPFGILSALGWRAFFPRRAMRRAATAALLACLVLLNLWALWVVPARIAWLPTR